jgi:hypothetical protein
MILVYHLPDIHSSMDPADPESAARLKRIVDAPTKDQFDSLTKKEFDFVVRSQFIHYQFIKAHPNVPVFAENGDSLDRNSLLLPENASSSPFSFYVKKFKEIFPKGVPSEFSQVTLTQQKFFFTYPGVLIALFDGTIQNSYGDFEPNYQLTRSDVQGQGTLPIQRQREFNSLYYISKTVYELQTDKAILIYGNGHLFDVKTCFPNIEFKSIMVSYSDGRVGWSDKPKAPGKEDLKIARGIKKQAEFKKRQDELNKKLGKSPKETPKLDDSTPFKPVPQFCKSPQLALRKYGISFNATEGFVPAPIMPSFTQPTAITSTTNDSPDLSYIAGLLALPLLAYSLFSACRSRRRPANANIRIEEDNTSVQAKKRN